MDETLLDHIRLLLQDTGTPPVVSDAQIENLAKTRRRLIYYEPLASEDEVTWYHSRNYIETVALSDSYEGTAFVEGASDDYTKDPIEGSFTLSEEQVSVYLYGYAYDLLDIVAQAWLVKAGILDAFPGLSYSLGDESVDKSGAKEYCVKQYRRYKTSKGGQLRRR
jgi:hypothetical protein